MNFTGFIIIIIIIIILHLFAEDILHAIDISQIGFHFSLDPPRYERAEFPLISNCRVYRCQGVIQKFPGAGSLVEGRPMKVADLHEAEK